MAFRTFRMILYEKVDRGQTRNGTRWINVFWWYCESDFDRTFSSPKYFAQKCITWNQTWNLSKILHRRIFRLKILHRQFHLISTVLVRKNTKNEWKWRNLHRWQKFYTAASSDGMYKLHLWLCLACCVRAFVCRCLSVSRGSSWTISKSLLLCLCDEGLAKSWVLLLSKHC